MHAWEQIQKTVDYIEEHLSEEINIEILAKLAALSPFYYQRLFSRLVKKPVAEYIKLRRMAKAAEALPKKEERILDIALELGFSSHEHFTRTFKDTFGMTPEEYRKNPKALNRMTKPELLLHYTLIDEGVPLITDGIILEINRKEITEPIHFSGIGKDFPVQQLDGLGQESGVDPLAVLWQDFHAKKQNVLGLPMDTEEIGVTLPSLKEGHFSYFAGARSVSGEVPDGFTSWEFPAGEYVVCSFEAENFQALVMDALYKALQYVYNIWLPNHKLQTEAFCAERYASHSPETTKMEIWLKLMKLNT
jgi:AraC family transcriptional regulator